MGSEEASASEHGLFRSCRQLRHARGRENAVPAARLRSPGGFQPQDAMAGIWRDKYRYKKAGVMLLELTPAARVQGGLFDAPNTAAAQARMRMIDVLNRRFGRNTVGFAAVGIQRTWNLRSDFISPRYTTSWDECCRCKTEAECAIATQTGCPIGPTLRNSARREFRCVQLLRIDRRERRQDQTEHSRRRCRLVLFCRHLGSRTYGRRSH